MELISKGTRIDATTWTSRLLARKITRPRFSLPLTEEQARDLLIAACRAEVQYRHRQFINTSAFIASVTHMARCLTSESSKFGLMLCGTCGNGKTTLLNALANAVNDLFDLGAWPVWPEGQPRGIVIKDAKEIAQTAADTKKFAKLRDYELLAIEDMGREPAEVLSYGNAFSPVIDLIEYRYARQLFTVITTNLTAAEIRERYRQRLADRFNEMLEVIIFEGESFRSVKP